MNESYQEAALREKMVGGDPSIFGGNPLASGPKRGVGRAAQSYGRAPDPSRLLNKTQKPPSQVPPLDPETRDRINKSINMS